MDKNELEALKKEIEEVRELINTYIDKDAIAGIDTGIKILNKNFKFPQPSILAASLISFGIVK